MTTCSLPQILSQVQDGMNNNYFVEAALMIPTLEKISADPHYLHLAQSRARRSSCAFRQISRNFRAVCIV